MGKLISKFSDFILNINENNNDRVNLLLREIVSSLSKEIEFDETPLKKEIEFNEYGGIVLYFSKGILTFNEIVDEAYHVLKSSGHSPILFSRKGLPDLILVQSKDKSFSIIIEPSGGTIRNATFSFALLLNGKVDFVGLLNDDYDSENISCIIWNGRSLVVVEFKGSIERDEKPRGFATGYFISVKSEDNNKYKLIANFVGNDDEGYDFESYEDIRIVK